MRRSTPQSKMAGKLDMSFYFNESNCRALNTLYDYQCRLEKTQPKRKRGGK